jgi:corrinoid protein of di/trimethylamine methyltransferase
MDDLLATLREAILTFEEEQAVGAVEELLAVGADPQLVLESGMTAAMLELGRRWTCGEAFLPEIVAAAQVFGKCSAVVEPALLASTGSRTVARVVLATVQGDLHDLGKNIVGAMLKTVGLEVHDLGSNISADRIVEATRALKPRIVGLSSLLTTTMPHQKTAIDELQAAGLRSRVKVMVGGAPVTQEWAEQIGADGYAANAAEAAHLALELLDD